MSKLSEVASEEFVMMNDGFGTNAPLPTIIGNTNVNVSDGIISAQKVAVSRNYANIMQQIKALAAVMGEKYYYSWPTKNKDGTKGRVEGGSIKLAMDLARLFGNCQIDCRVQETATHLMIYAKFVDIETGFSLTRPFQQRKNQNTGMKDADRQQDIVLQIGASKAIRNVVLNSMPTLAEYGMQEAKKGLKNRIEKNPGEAKKAILELITELNIDIKSIESIVGSKSDKWTINDLTKLWVELNTIKDGYANIEDIYPAESKLTGLVNTNKETADHDPETGEITAKESEKTPKETVKPAAKTVAPVNQPPAEKKPQPELFSVSDSVGDPYATGLTLDQAAEELIGQLTDMEKGPGRFAFIKENRYVIQQVVDNSTNFSRHLIPLLS